MKLIYKAGDCFKALVRLSNRLQQKPVRSVLCRKEADFVEEAAACKLSAYLCTGQHVHNMPSKQVGSLQTL